ncbi:MAG TPA: hypothetical protein VJQ56_00575, partial [Blastocatellia bacterium]|nr:hypothetical protein [Blastocatellia bacterium]
MSTTATADDTLVQEEARAQVANRTGLLWWPRLGVRSRQIALITLLVALVVAVTTLANITHLTAVLINRTHEEARQLSNQISYGVRQQLALSTDVNHPAAYDTLARQHSGVRGLMESTIVTSRTIVYLYLTDEKGEIIKDAEGKNELAANRYMIGDVGAEKPDLSKLAGESGLTQLARVFFGPPAFEFSRQLTSDGSLAGGLHIGVSAAAVRRELLSPIATNLFIGLIAVLGAAIVAISSANLLLRPLEAISTSIDRLGLSGGTADLSVDTLPRDDTVTEVTTRIRQLGERLAGERTELELMRGRLRQVIGHLEERLLLINREGRV